MYKTSIEDVVPGIMLEQDIYGDNTKGNPLLVAGTRITANFIYRLKKRGISTLYTSVPINIGNKTSTTRKVINNPISGLYVAEKSKPVVAHKTKEEVIKTMKNFHISLSGLDAEDVYEIVSDLDGILNKVLNDLPENLTMPINVHQLRGDSNGIYIYKHALSVAVISMAIGQYLSLPPDEVLKLGKSASIHDIGMFLVPSDILHKEGRLSRDELENIKRHTLLGYRCSVKLGIADEAINDAILYHHERVDGTGYPLGLSGEDIPLWSRIIAIADVYDAMTSPRSHRKAMTPADTCEFIMSNANTSFEYDIVAALLRRIEFYPMGICVKLSNGNYAVIVENRKNKLRPTIRILDSDIIIDLNERKNFDITILNAVSYQDIIERR